MDINASLVMKLREETGLGMMTCKKALAEAQGDMEKAIDNLRKQGQSTAAKRASKAAKEGKVEVLLKGSDVLIYEVNSETDFVARNNDFLSFVEKIGAVLLENKPADMAAARALTSPHFGGMTVEAKGMEIVGKIGEKISFRRFHLATINSAKERAFSYIHGNGKIGVVVTLSVSAGAALHSDAIMELGKDLAMQVAASKPLAAKRDKVPEAIVAKEKEIYREQVKASGKPETIWDKIVEGKINKYYNQVVLVEQEFIKDTELTVAARIRNVEKECACAIDIVSFVRFELGEEE
jgi:elongation factor Ts